MNHTSIPIKRHSLYRFLVITTGIYLTHQQTLCKQTDALKDKPYNYPGFLKTHAKPALSSWGGEHETVSGNGSTLAATVEIRDLLPRVFKMTQAQTLLDIPCGDFHWMSHTDLSHMTYYGMDIIPQLIEQNSRKYESDSRKFQLGDVTKSDLPQVDLILCKDLFIHLPNSYIMQAIQNFKRSESTYLLVSTFNIPNNIEMPRKCGSNLVGYRPVNLEAPPFNFPTPMLKIEEKEQRRKSIHKFVALWKISDLP